VNADSYPRFLVSLVFVIGLVGLFAWLLRKFGPPARFRLQNRRRLSIVEIQPLDARRRLVLLRRDDREHLILLGVTQDLVIETGIVPPPDAPDFAAQLSNPPESRS
jgi:flagellar protein FliO/FliZ